MIRGTSPEVRNHSCAQAPIRSSAIAHNGGELGDRVPPQRLNHLRKLQYVDPALEPLRLGHPRLRLGEPIRQGALGDARAPPELDQVADEVPVGWIL